ncbi:MAG: prepilin-type N-terminal cleavage/methylation domain-containing protein [Kiritimatiellae bacterium]|nr:prepilin-type N-terminal cleavage/methylation domain-containing protein [Kiritimatiellia bacterium]
MVAARKNRGGFTLVEVLIATVVLSVSLFGLLQAMMTCQRLMTASRRFETAQYVLNLGEMAHPVPLSEKVTDDPLDNDLLNIPATDALELADEIELDLTRQEREDLAGYTFERSVDEYKESGDGRVMEHEDELKRNGNLYTLRTTVKWGGDRYGGKKDEETVIRLWRKDK